MVYKWLYIVWGWISLTDNVNTIWFVHFHITKNISWMLPFKSWHQWHCNDMSMQWISYFAFWWKFTYEKIMDVWHYSDTIMTKMNVGKPYQKIQGGILKCSLSTYKALLFMEKHHFWSGWGLYEEKGVWNFAPSEESSGFKNCVDFGMLPHSDK